MNIPEVLYRSFPVTSLYLDASGEILAKVPRTEQGVAVMNTPEIKVVGPGEEMKKAGEGKFIYDFKISAEVDNVWTEIFKINPKGSAAHFSVAKKMILIATPENLQAAYNCSKQAIEETNKAYLVGRQVVVKAVKAHLEQQSAQERAERERMNAAAAALRNLEL